MYVGLGKTIVVNHMDILTILDIREIKDATKRDSWLENPRTQMIVDHHRVKSLVVTPFLTYASPLSPQNLLKKMNETSRRKRL
jgi:hypothetical protein